MDRESRIEDIARILGRHPSQFKSLFSEYESNGLTAEIDPENFEILFWMICNDQLYKMFKEDDVAITILNHFTGHTYGRLGLSRPFSLKTVIENIVPFVVVNNLFSVFRFKEKDLPNKREAETLYALTYLNAKTEAITEFFYKKGFKKFELEKVV